MTCPLRREKSATFPFRRKRRRSFCLSTVKVSVVPFVLRVTDWTWRRNSSARGSIAPTTRVEVLSGVTTKVAPSTVWECEIRVGMRIRGISVGSGLPVFPLSNLTDSPRSKEKDDPRRADVDPRGDSGKRFEADTPIADRVAACLGRARTAA